MTTQTTQVHNTASPPSGWVETTLGEVAVLNYGKSLNTSKRIKGDIPVYGSSGITGWHNESLVETRGIIIGRKGTVGVIYKSSIPFFPIDTVYFLTQEDTKCDLDFLYNLLLNLGLEKMNADSAVPGLNRNDAYSRKILLPPLPEQRAIAGVLSAFDDKIELLREQNKTLEASAQAIFGEWFGKYSPDRPEDLPEGWRVGKIGEIIQRFSIPYKCTKSDLEPKGKTKIFDQGTSGLYGYTSRQPDFEASKENPVILFTNHTCNYWFVDYSFCAIQNVIPYRGKDNYDVYFLYFMTKGSIEFIEYKGHWPDFEAKDFIIPPANLAEKFSKFSKPILEKISENNSQIQTLSTFRDTLLPRLMRGEVRVGF